MPLVRLGSNELLSRCGVLIELNLDDDWIAYQRINKLA